jgi:hypothetical protein
MGVGMRRSGVVRMSIRGTRPAPAPAPRRRRARLRSGWCVLWVAGVVSGCGSSGGTLSAGGASAAAQGVTASCAGLTAAQQLKAARVVFDGRMITGPTVRMGGTSVLASPARVLVMRYLKGHGPGTVGVQTADTSSGTEVTVDAEGIEPRAGQWWRIFSDRSRPPFPTSICAGSRQIRPPGGSHRRFSGDGVSFAYPSSWRARHYQVTSSFSTEIVYLTPQRMHPPCVTRHATRNTTITCRQPITRLGPGSLLAFWSIDSMPGRSFKDAAGQRLRIGGHSARLRITHDSCEIGAQQSMDAVIPVTTSPENWYEFIACIRGPRISLREHQLRDLLSSVRFDR